jgi:hypothetical protein
LKSFLPIALLVLLGLVVIFLLRGLGRRRVFGAVTQFLSKRFGGERPVSGLSALVDGFGPVRALLVFVFIYSVGLCASRTYFQEDIIGTRLASPLYPALLLLGAFFIGRVWSFFSPARFSSDRSNGPVGVIGSTSSMVNSFFCLVLVFLVIGFFSIHALSFYRSLTGLEGSRQFNSPYWLEDDGVLWVEENASADMVIFSNHADGLSFLLGRPVRWVPDRSNPDRVIEWFQHVSNLSRPNLVMLYSFNARERRTLSKEDLVGMGLVEEDTGMGPGTDKEFDFELVIHLNTSRVSVFSISSK